MKSKLVSWGANTYGQLGQGLKSEQCFHLKEVNSETLPFNPLNITSISGGGGHSIVLLNDGRVFSCGLNNKGQLGHGTDKETLHFEEINQLRNDIITQVSCGWDYNLAVNQDGELFVWGSNAFGQLGLPKKKVPFTSVPVKLQVPRIKCVASGLRHSAMIMMSGEVLVCGYGKKGQLGLVDSNGKPVLETEIPHQVAGLSDICTIACGQNHTIAMTMKGQILLWGDNKHGQMGADPKIYSTFFTPMELKTLSHLHYGSCSLYSGWTHNIMLTENGNIINWGRNTYGQLGCCEYQRPELWKPAFLDTGNIGNIIQIAAGSEHNIAILSSGQLISWGWNEHGNCGTGTEDNVFVPTVISEGAKQKAVLVGAGAGHSFAVLKQDEKQAKFIHERITSVEKHFAELCTAFAAYTRKTAALRDKSDELVKAIQHYSEAENVNKSLKSGLSQFSVTLSCLGDHRDAEVRRLETKVVSEFSQYEAICKHAKEEVKNTFIARDRELARRKQLDRIRERNPRNRQQISLAESELLKATAEVSRTVKALEEQTDMFEKKKLQDIKSLLFAFVTIELSFHAKAVEFYTKAYQEISNIDEDEDLEEFRNALRVPDSISRLETVKRTSFRSSAFSIANLFTTPTSFRRPTQGIPHSPTRSSDVVEVLKPGCEGSLESVNIDDYGEDESSSVISEEEEKRHIVFSKVKRNAAQKLQFCNEAHKNLYGLGSDAVFNKTFG